MGVKPIGDVVLIPHRCASPKSPNSENCAEFGPSIGIGGVDLAVEWYDGTQTVVGAIELFKPNYFTKGGDRDNPEAIPEWGTCEKVGCGIILGVGGEKVQSSSALIENAGTAEE